MTCSSNSDFWAITTYFNAERDRRRRENFEVFAGYLEIPLLVVELATAGSPTLSGGANCRVMGVQGDAGIWQKERLLNLALAALPDSVTHVAWLDADIVLKDPDWPAAARRKLDGGASFVQLFSVARQVAPDHAVSGLSRSELFALPTTEFSQSFAGAQARGLIHDDHAFRALVDTWDGRKHDDVPEESSRPQTGFAWAAKRSTLRSARFYEHFIVGGGDRAFCFAAARRPEVVLRERPLTRAHRDHYLAWAHRFEARGNSGIACLDLELRHLWHGSVESRRYRDRFSILLDHAYDPVRDVVTGKGGALAWRHPTGDLAEGVAAYFRARQENA